MTFLVGLGIKKSKKTSTKSKNGRQKTKKRRGKTIKTKKRGAGRQILRFCAFRSVLWCFCNDFRFFFLVFLGDFRLFYKHLPCVPWSLSMLLIVLQAPSGHSPDTFLVIFERF